MAPHMRLALPGLAMAAAVSEGCRHTYVHRHVRTDMYTDIHTIRTYIHMYIAVGWLLDRCMAPLMRLAFPGLAMAATVSEGCRHTYVRSCKRRYIHTHVHMYMRT
jgi:hypothetical protein